MTTLQPSWEGETVEIVESQPTGDPTYDAFISYSHTADRKLAPALRDGLHRFAKPWYRRRAMRVFQDTSNLESSPDLWATIQAALRGSRALVLLASASSAMSQWVAREIQTWRLANRMPDGTLQPDRPILIVLTDGEIVWDHAAGDFDWTRTTALPRALSGVFRAEPLWLDLRWAHTEEQLSLRDPRFRDAIASLVAAIRHQSKDDLIGEDVRVWRRNRRVAWAAASLLMVLTLVAAGLGYTANVARQDAVDKNTALQQALRESKANELLLQSVQARGTDPQLALRLGAAALAINPVVTNRRELVTTLVGTRFDGGASVSPSGQLTGRLVSAVAPGATVVVDGSWNYDVTSYGLTVWDASDPRTPVQLGELPGVPEMPNMVRFSPDGRLVASADTVELTAHVGTITLSDLAARTTMTSLADLDGLSGFAMSADNTLLAAVGDPEVQIVGPVAPVERGWLRLWDITDATAPVLLTTQTGLFDSNDVAFTPDGRAIVVAGGVLVVNDDPAKSIPSGASVWDITDPTQPRRNAKRLLLNDGHLAISPAAPLLALPSSGADTVALYDLSDPDKPVALGDGVPTLARGIGAQVVVAFSADGRLLAVSAQNSTEDIDTYKTQLWDLADPESPVLVANLANWGTPVTALGFSSDGTTLTTVDDNQALIRWRVNTRGIDKVASVDVLVPGLDIFTGKDFGPEPVLTWTVAVSQDGSLTAVGDSSLLTTSGLVQEVHLFDTRDPAHPVELSRFAQDVKAVAFSPDGKLLATGSQVYGRDHDEVTLWDISDPAAPTVVSTMDIPPSPSSVAFHPHLPMLSVTGAADSGDWISVFDITDPTAPHAIELPDGEYYSYQNVFSPDGALLALGGQLWDVSSPGRVVPVESGLTGDDAYLLPGIGPVVFSPDGTTVVTESLSEMTAWDISDLSAPQRLWAGELDLAVQHWLLSADQRVLIGGTGDGRLFAYDTSGNTPTLLASFQAQNEQFVQLAWGPDDAWFTGSGGDAFKIWSVGALTTILADPMQVACAAAGPLTPEEWDDQYVKIYPYEDLCA